MLHRSVFRRFGERPRLNHDIARVERAMADVLQIQAHEERQTFRSNTKLGESFVLCYESKTHRSSMFISCGLIGLPQSSRRRIGLRIVSGGKLSSSSSYEEYSQ